VIAGLVIRKMLMKLRRCRKRVASVLAANLVLQLV
jgi:hypothetical protein